MWLRGRMFQCEAVQLELKFFESTAKKVNTTPNNVKARWDWFKSKWFLMTFKARISISFALISVKSRVRVLPWHFQKRVGILANIMRFKLYKKLKGQHQHKQSSSVFNAASKVAGLNGLHLLQCVSPREWYSLSNPHKLKLYWCNLRARASWGLHLTENITLM